MRFIDRVRIQVHAGDGGNGAVAWRREAHVPLGGPAGGDGGSGGDIWFVADDQLSTLLDLKFRQIYRAEAGRAGSGKNRNGRAGEDRIIHVPVGTSIYYEGEVGEPGDPLPWAADEDEQASDDEGIRWSPDDSDVFDDEPPADDELAEPNESEDDAEAGELENVWVSDKGISHTPPTLPAGAVEPEPEPERPRELAGAPPEVRMTISEGAQRQRMAEHARERPRRSPKRHRGDLIGDLDQSGKRLLVAHGGRGGRGNVHFVSSTNRSPDRAEPGTPGESMWLRLELKLLADVGIVGFPNVGKSTLISRISRARPEIADYPFTTLAPQLGVVQLSNERSMVVADIPGLIEGASEGKGLGHQFLRHLERTRVLLHLLAPDPTPGRDVLGDLDVLEDELRRYGDMFEGRPRVVALNKIDTPEGEALVKATRRALRDRNIPLFPISAVTGEGLEPLLEALWRRLEMVRERERQQGGAQPIEPIGEVEDDLVGDG